MYYAYIVTRDGLYLSIDAESFAAYWSEFRYAEMFSEYQANLLALTYNAIVQRVKVEICIT